MPIFEPGLDLLIKNVAADRLYFNSNMKDCIDSLDVLFVAVDTPTRRADGQADLNSLFSAIKEIANISKDKKIVVIKSTVPPVKWNQQKSGEYAERYFKRI